MPDRTAEPWVLHTARDGTRAVHRRRRQHQGGAGQLPSTRTTRRACRASRSTRTSPPTGGCTLYYAPPLSTPAGDAPATGTPAQLAPFNGVNRLSRLHRTGRQHARPGQREEVLEVPTSRGQCCHVGGDLDFDAAGQPVSVHRRRHQSVRVQRLLADRRAGRPQPGTTTPSGRPPTPTTCAARSCGSSPARTASYTIPAGNMFASGTPNTRPEIYAMGFRNPFRMSVDQATGVVYLGDYGPDAGAANPQPRAGRDRWRSTGSPSRASTAGRTARASTSRDLQRIHIRQWTGWASTTARAGRPTTRRTTPASHSCRRPGHLAAVRLWPGLAAELFCGGLVADGRAGLPLRRGADSGRQVPGLDSGKFFAGEFGRKWIKTVTPTGNGGVRCDLTVPLDGYAGDGHGVRSGRCPVRAGLRHRVVRWGRQLGVVPHRVHRAGAGHRSRSRTPIRPPAMRR